MESATRLRLDQPIRTSKRKKEARSPQQQRDLAQTCADTNGYEIAMVHDSERNESGKTMNRASLNAIMDRIRAGQTDGVIVALTDRLGRAPIEEAMAWVRELHAVGGVLVLADAGGRPVDLSDPQVETNLVLQLQIARQFWATMAKRMLQTRVGAVKAGKFVGPAPLGYQRERGRLVPDPVLGPMMTTTFQLAARDGLHAAAAHLKRHVPERNWTTDHVRRVLRSRTYLGESRSGDEIEPNLHAHDALTDIATWTAAQTDPGHRRANGTYPLSHLARCGRCGWGLVGALQTVREKAYRRMRCSNPACKGGCSVSAEKLETHVRAEVELLLSNRVFVDEFSPAGLPEAEAAMLAAKAERTALTSKVKPSDPDFSTWLAQADALVSETTNEFTRLSALADQSETLPGPHELDKPEQYARALRAVTGRVRIVVAPGRGSIEDRVDFERHDHMAGTLAA